MAVDGAQLRAYVEYLRDLGVWDLYRREGATPTELPGAPVVPVQVKPGGPTAASLNGAATADAATREPGSSGASRPAGLARPAAADRARTVVALSGGQTVAGVGLVAAAAGRPVSAEVGATAGRPGEGSELEVAIPKPVPFDELAPLPEVRVRPEDRAAALVQVRELIGDCTRCPLAYAGRRTIVFGEGDPKARLMFVGEGPGADEDESGRPFVGKAGQLLNNMIAAMGVRREDVYIANIVKCRPPQNRVPEPVEANTCSQFLLEQIDIVQPEVIVALGSTAATYLLGVKQSLSSLRGQWKSCRGAKVAVTFHPAYLLRDPRQKAEAWKDLQRVMAELGLNAPAKG